MTRLLYSEDELCRAAEVAVDAARRLGAEASVSARSSAGARVTARSGAVESAVQDADQTVSISIYREGKTGSASTASLNRQAIEQAVAEADAIARFVQKDPYSGLPDASLLATSDHEVALYEHDPSGPAALVETALAIDRAGNGSSWHVSEAGAASSEGIWTLATSSGFLRSSRYSDQVRWCAILASGEQESVRDYFESRDRRAHCLAAPDAVARTAVERTLGVRAARQVSSRRTPVLLEPRAAMSIIGDLAGALSGAAQHRRTSFLQEPVGRSVAASHLDLAEDPFEPFGLASAPFDSDGIAGSQRLVIEAGVARGLFLGVRSARQLGLKSTGNADGPYNLKLTSRKEPRSARDLLKDMGTGFFVSQLAGGATNPVTGVWTRAARGFWVDDGEIAHAVHDVTLAGDLKAMLAGIVAVGADVERHGGIRVGSVLIDEMQLGGAA